MAVTKVWQLYRVEMSSLYPLGFSPKNSHDTPSTHDLEDGELLPHAGCEKMEGDVPEFRPGKSGKGVSIEDGKIVSVFVDNIPAGHKASWLRKSFYSFGKIVDSYIPGHKSKATNRLYGFVRFVGSSAALSAISCMNGFWVGNNQLIVREARFSKFSNIGRRKPTPVENLQNLYQSPNLGGIQGREHFASTGIRSYAQVLSGVSRGSGVVHRKNLNICGVESSLGWLDNSVIALASGRTSFDVLSDHLFKTMKGLSDLRLWNGELVNPMRLVWLSCECLPLSIWNLDSFKLIASLWGNLVAVDEVTYNATDLFKARLLIETEVLDVGGAIEVSAGNAVFDVVVKEEVGGSALGFWPESKVVLLHDLGSSPFDLSGKDV